VRFFVRQRPLILLAFALWLGGSATYASAQAQSSPTGSSTAKPTQPAGNSPAANPADDGKQAQEQAKFLLKTHKVLTNDDLKGIGHTQGSVISEIEINGINDCDRNCFDRVRTSAGPLAGADGQWKRDLLQGIEKVTADAKWQGALLAMARLKGKYCDLTAEKNDALADFANPKNVTEAELAIDEEYDRKFKAAQQEFNATYADADALKRTYSGIVVPFMTIQQGRVTNAPCIQPQPTRHPRYQQPEPDDPDDP
jgi:hypothetical protein